MWAIYWRSLLAVFIVFSIAVIAVQQFSLLSLIENSSYHPTAFWLIAASITLAFSLIKPKGLTYSIFGSRLNFRPSLWRQLNLGFMAFFIILAILASAAQAFTTASAWASYKLYLQPLLLVFYPWLAGSFLLHRLKHNKGYINAE